MIFVYVRGLRGPSPEKWPDMLTDMMGQPVPYLEAHRLDDDDAKLSLDELAKKYPAA